MAVASDWVDPCAAHSSFSPTFRPISSGHSLADATSLYTKLVTGSSRYTVPLGERGQARWAVRNGGGGCRGKRKDGTRKRAWSPNMQQDSRESGDLLAGACVQV